MGMTYEAIINLKLLGVLCFVIIKNIFQSFRGYLNLQMHAKIEKCSNSPDS